MLTSPPLPNLLANLWSDLHDVAFLWQVAATVVSLLLAWLAGKLLQPRIASMENSPTVGRDALAAIQLPLVALLLIMAVRALIPGAQTLLDLMVALLTAAILIRLVVVMLRQVFAPSGWRDQSIRFIAAVVWIGFALYIAGLLPDLLKFLDALGFSVGKQRISLLLILQAVLSVLATLVSIVVSTMMLKRFMKWDAAAPTSSSRVSTGLAACRTHSSDNSSTVTANRNTASDPRNPQPCSEPP